MSLKNRKSQTKGKSKMITNNPSQKLLKGVSTLAQAVGTTLGARGRNVGINKGFEDIILHDGVSVAREVKLKDPVENFGANIVKQAAEKQVNQCGDGTTAVTVLSHAIFKECVSAIATGTNAMSLRKGLEGGAKLLTSEVSKKAIKIKSLKETIQIATISAEDPIMGEMIGRTIYENPEGIVTVEESKSDLTEVEKQEGMQFDKGYISPYFVTDQNRMESTIENAALIICDKTITNIQDVIGFLEKVAKVTTHVVIIAPDVTDSALASFIVTKMQGGMNLTCVRAPLFSQKQKDFLMDIAILTGGKLISEDQGMTFDSLDVDVLGHAGRVTATKDATLIVDGKGSKKEIKERVESLREQLKTQTGFEAEKLRERIAKLSTGVAVVKVGGHTEIEMKERKERALDAVSATQSALESGIVPGGETTYLSIREVLDNSVAHRILYKALEAPFTKLIENAGMNAGQMMSEIKYANLNSVGVDVTTGEIKDMLKAGIIDPAKILISAINNSVSVATQLMTCDVIITPDDKK